MRFPISRPYLIGALAAGVGFAAAMARRSGPTFHWPGKVVLITGGSRGLGFGLAWELAKKGGNVVICGRDQSQLDAAESSLRQITDQVVAVQCDVSDPEQV